MSFLVRTVINTLMVIGLLGPVSSRSSTINFQQGKNGYWGATDIHLRGGWPNATGYGDIVYADFPKPSDPDPVQHGFHGLIRFDIIGQGPDKISIGSEIISATLTLTTGSLDRQAQGHGAEFYRMLIPWSESATWNSVNNGIQADGFEAETMPSASVGSSTLQPKVMPGPVSIDVTSDVQEWAYGMPNYGWAILPWPNGMDGWGFWSSEYYNADLRPKLTVVLAPDTHYVSISNPTPMPPYTSWETAANNIQEAVDAAENGDVVLVTNGTYKISSQILIRKSVALKSVNGWESTIIDAESHCRVIRIYAIAGQVLVDGFTVTGGFVDYDNSVGGGIASSGDGALRISNCCIINNEALRHGGGIHVGGNPGMVYDVLISNCIVGENKAGIHGGGIHVPMWRNRTGTVSIEDCIVSGNECTGEGGGIRCLSYEGFETVTRCILTHNKAGQAGGVMLGTETLISDSLIFGNKATSGSGGGIRRGGPGGGPVINCTVVSNNSSTAAGGVHSPGIFNSIIYGNTAPSYPDIMSETAVAYSCSPNLTNGLNGNISDNPQFRNPTYGDYRLLMTSPCLDNGTNTFVYSATDLDGAARIMDGNLDGTSVVDMGAYELQATLISIDIKPGSKTNPVNLKSKGWLPLAVITTDVFDALDVDPAAILLAGATPVHNAVEDVDGDGHADLLLHFLTQELRLTDASTQAYLIGQTYDGQILMGVDSIRIVPKNK